MKNIKALPTLKKVRVNDSIAGVRKAACRTISYFFTGLKPVLRFEFGDNGCMVAGTLGGARLFVDVTGGAFFGEGFCSHDVV